MEIIKKTNNKNKVRKGPESEQKWGILKYLSAKIFTEKTEYSGSEDMCQWDLRSKIGVWQMPLFKFLRPETWRWNLWFDGTKRLKYKSTPIFDLRCCEMLMMQVWMQDDKDDLTGVETTMGYPNSSKKGIRLCWGITVPLWKRLSTTVSVWNDSLMKTKLFGDITWTDKLGMTLERENVISNWNLAKGKLKRSVV
jgi:hypothetical protein